MRAGRYHEAQRPPNEAIRCNGKLTHAASAAATAAQLRRQRVAPAYSRLPASRAATHCFRATFCRLLSRTRGRSTFISASASAAPLARPSAAREGRAHQAGAGGWHTTTCGWHDNRDCSGMHHAPALHTPSALPQPQAKPLWTRRLTNQDGCQHRGAAPVPMGAVHQNLAPHRPLRQRPVDALQG